MVRNNTHSHFLQIGRVGFPLKPLANSKLSVAYVSKEESDIPGICGPFSWSLDIGGEFPFLRASTPEVYFTPDSHTVYAERRYSVGWISFGCTGSQRRCPSKLFF